MWKREIKKVFPIAESARWQIKKYHGRKWRIFHHHPCNYFLISQHWVLFDLVSISMLLTLKLTIIWCNNMKLGGPCDVNLKSNMHKWLTFMHRGCFVYSLIQIEIWSPSYLISSTLPSLIIKYEERYHHKNVLQSLRCHASSSLCFFRFFSSILLRFMRNVH